MTLSSNTVAPKEDPAFTAAKKGEWNNIVGLCTIKTSDERRYTHRISIRPSNPPPMPSITGGSGFSRAPNRHITAAHTVIIPAQYELSSEIIKNAVAGAIAGDFFSSDEKTKSSLQNILNHTSEKFFNKFLHYLRNHTPIPYNDIIKSIQDFEELLNNRRAFIGDLKKYSGSFWIYHKKRANSFLTDCRDKDKEELSSMIQKQLSLFQPAGVGAGPSGEKLSDKKHEQPLENKKKDEFYTLLETYSKKFT